MPVSSELYPEKAFEFMKKSQDKHLPVDESPPVEMWWVIAKSSGRAQAWNCSSASDWSIDVLKNSKLQGRFTRAQISIASWFLVLCTMFLLK